jgi:hypothetical protein
MAYFEQIGMAQCGINRVASWLDDYCPSGKADGGKCDKREKCSNSGSRQRPLSSERHNRFIISLIAAWLDAIYHAISAYPTKSIYPVFFAAVGRHNSAR